MLKDRTFRRRLIEILLALDVLLIILILTYGHFVKIPYIGFRYNTSTGVVEQVFVEQASSHNLNPKDIIQQVKEIPFKEFDQNTASQLFETLGSGDSIDVVVERARQNITIPWVIPGFNLEEFRYRLFGSWWMPYIFWLMGSITLFLVQPSDIRKNLLVAVNYLIAIWFAAGQVSWYGVFYSTIILTVGVWLTWPVSWHLNWMFPQPFRKFPRLFWLILYTIAIYLAFATINNVVASTSYAVGAILAAMGSAIMLLFHAIFQQPRTRLVFLFIVVLFLALAPSVALNTTRITGTFLSTLQQLTLLPLILLPIAYLYVLVYRRPGGLELRVNKAISIFTYAALILFTGMLVIGSANALSESPRINQEILITLVAFFTLLVGFLAARMYPFYNNWVQKSLLGMRVAQTDLVQTYAAQITTSLEWEKLQSILEEDILPSMLVRQAALIRVEGLQQDQAAPRVIPVFSFGIQPEDLPEPVDIQPLISETGVLRPLPTNQQFLHCQWIRLVLLLSVEDKIIGLFLFGRRDPDDYYSPREIQTLQALMNQTALAIVNIEQSARLRALYQWDIEREETEKKRLALELHDDVLGQMALLPQSAGAGQLGDQFDKTYHDTVQRIRDVISGLRPSGLNYSLYAALSELVDDVYKQNDKQNSDNPALDLLIPSNMERYPPEVELHVFRIVQQALQNALKHAQASEICISGQMDPGYIHLAVQDNGIGLVSGEDLDLAHLLAEQHFGLAGMHERAAIINADLNINSSPGAGTTISIAWRDNGKGSNFTVI